MKKGPFKMKGPSGLKLKKSPVKDIKSYGAYSSAEEKAAAKDHNAIHRGKVPGTETRTIYPKKKKEK